MRSFTADYPTNFSGYQTALQRAQRWVNQNASGPVSVRVCNDPEGRFTHQVRVLTPHLSQNCPYCGKAKRGWRTHNVEVLCAACEGKVRQGDEDGHQS